MMLKHMLLAASAVLLISLPTVSLAQKDKGPPAASDKKDQRPPNKPSSNQPRGGGQGGPQNQARPQAQAAPQNQGRPQGQARPQAQAAPQGQGRPQGQARPQAQAAPQGQGRPQGHARPQAQAAPQGRPQGQARPQAQAAPQNQAGPQGQGGRASGNQTVTAASHVQQRSQWRSGHPDSNRGTVWQRDPNWWHSNAAFRTYTGVRVNFFFAPGFGYYSVPREYWGRHWSTGAYLPLFFLRYTVGDYQDYGLPPPPYDCSWVWVDTSVFLIDRSDGYILDEIDNVW